MSFNSASLQAKLATVNETQESITTVSQWVMFHKRHAETSATVWAQNLTEAPTNRKLGLIYVANEIVQQAKIKKRDGFVEAFGRVLPQAIGDAFASVPRNIQERITRVIGVWKDRLIFPPEVQEKIEGHVPSRGATDSSFFSRAAPKAAPGDGSSSVPTSDVGAIPPALKELTTAWGNLHSSQELWGSKKDATDAKYLSVFNDHAPAPLEYLQKAENLQQSLSSTVTVVSALDQHYTDAIAALEKLLETTRAQQQTLKNDRASLDAKVEHTSETIRDLVKMLHGDDELPSPDIEPPTPEAESDEAEEYVPAVYTAKDAESGYAADPENDEIGYAEDSEDEDQDVKNDLEPEAKKQKVELNPDLASFLASMSQKQ